MIKSQKDIIAAQATPPGNAGVGIIRLSGENLLDITQQLIKKIPSPRMAEYLPFYDKNKNPIDFGLAIYFPGPNSFTGEDVLELHGHGGQVIMDVLLKRVVSCGARLAEPGEFSYRAFMNDKIDLAQAEAISDLINASTEEAARSAIRSLKGDFSEKIHALLKQLIHTRMYVESSIDFPEEEIDFLADGELTRLVKELIKNLNQIFSVAKQGCVLNEGMTVVIAGQPNAGKSSLLNQLAGYDAAIVTDIAGTTRDVLKESINIDGMPLHIIDTAGLRENADVVEKEGIKRAWKEIESANHIILVVDHSKGKTEIDQQILDQLPENLPVTIVFNKIDLKNQSASIIKRDTLSEVYLSAKHAQGLELLLEHLKQSMGYQGNSDGLFIARHRHLNALERAREFVETGYQQLQEHSAGELLAEDLRQAQSALNEITGEFDNEDLLGEIFSSFCIGK
ncbi:MAG: tRNA uridine-5-carboxymethylaminomethyl(34) synthesis GTPase MnmE [Gammaproteobacteria bacterium]|nr:tRNA uridine-5-carboxymethylaminomethyl(34) synthesis GTPase MnmE [Gammaproteobacteria bacterium]